MLSTCRNSPLSLRIQSLLFPAIFVITEKGNYSNSYDRIITRVGYEYSYQNSL